jgi:hypothetical protein
MSHAGFVDMFVIYVNTKFYVLSSSGSLCTAQELNANFVQSLCFYYTF